jgi:nucleotide-binding universal stress UspA family protein
MLIVGAEVLMNPTMHVAPLPADLRQRSRIRFKSILLATDLGTASSPAQAYALQLAHMFGAHLFVLHVETDPGLSPRCKEAVLPTTPQTSNPEIAELEELLRFSGVPFTLLLEHGEVHEALNRVADERGIDLIVLGSHGRKGISHLLQGSMAESVGRSSSRPVITVGPNALTGFGTSVKTIIYATDFSDESKLALPYAASLAQEVHAHLAILHVAPRTERLVRDRVHVEAYLMNRLKGLAPQSQLPWCTASYEIAFGDPAKEILKMASERSGDLIVLGLHRSIEFTSHFPERLSYSVIREAPCPVLSVLPGPRELKLAKLPAAFLAMAPHMN